MDQRQFIKQMVQTRPYWAAEEFIARRVLSAAGVSGNKGRTHLKTVITQTENTTSSGLWDASVVMLKKALELGGWRKNATVLGLDQGAIPRNGGLHNVIQKSSYVIVNHQDNFTMISDCVYLARTSETGCHAGYVLRNTDLPKALPPFSVYSGHDLCPEDASIIIVVQKLDAFLQMVDIKQAPEGLYL